MWTITPTEIITSVCWWYSVFVMLYGGCDCFRWAQMRYREQRNCWRHAGVEQMLKYHNLWCGPTVWLEWGLIFWLGTGVNCIDTCAPSAYKNIIFLAGDVKLLHLIMCSLTESPDIVDIDKLIHFSYHIFSIYDFQLNGHVTKAQQVIFYHLPDLQLKGKSHL